MDMIPIMTIKAQRKKVVIMLRRDAPVQNVRPSPYNNGWVSYSSCSQGPSQLNMNQAFLSPWNEWKCRVPQRIEKEFKSLTDLEEMGVCKEYF